MTRDPGGPLGVVVMAYGGPDSLDEVAPYLLDIRGGRPTPPELIAEVRERYRRIGGRSPLRAVTEAQARALEMELQARGNAVAVTVGMRHWKPRIAEAVAHLAGRGVRAAVAVAMAPHYARRSVGEYHRQVQAACGALPAAPRFAFVSHYCDHPRFVAAVARDLRRVRAGLADPERVRVLFSAHSLPAAWLEEGDPYVAQLRESAAAVAARAGLPAGSWRQCFQSAGARPGAWLGPSLTAELHAAARSGVPAVLVVPFGFVADHVEVLYDIDLELRELGATLGVAVARTPALGTDPDLIAAVADRVLDAASTVR